MPGITCQPGRNPTASDTHHEDAIYYNNQIVKDHQTVVWLSQATIAHWVGAISARQKWLSTSAGV
ncbi:MAG TPA: hypothetical protein VFK94_00940, partial [Patescibacteria group bacterium]|nr:hypothetical protein [Patescibacteria group bacterium]